ncbi:MAG TPA: hypothetical protein VFF53_10710 [Geobacteraceae bacterium]|nr:hypothetical protein [Geobacteraceae bacterium]
MTVVLRLLLLGCLIVAFRPAMAADDLPQLRSTGPEGLPSLSASSINVATVADKTLSVTCYLGNPKDRDTLGSIAVSNSLEAGPACNSLNYACRGRCFGCYSDFDLSEDVCVDSAGRRFLR